MSSAAVGAFLQKVDAMTTWGQPLRSFVTTELVFLRMCEKADFPLISTDRILSVTLLGHFCVM